MCCSVVPVAVEIGGSLGSVEPCTGMWLCIKENIRNL